jgi:hypothetical protein
MDKFANRLSMRLVALALGVPAMCAIGPMNSALASPPIHRPTLDLRPPAPDMTAAEKMPTTFPSMRRTTLGGQEQVQLSSSSSVSRQARIPGRVEELVLHFHREGLPLARLWENKSALVSLGLNPKGKPGLWITQKTH